MTTGAVRPYVESDKDSVIDILTTSQPWTTLGYTQSDWQRYFTPLAAGREAYVLEADHRPAGFAILRPKFLLGDYLELFGVAAWARGQALGAQLLRHIEALSFSRGKNLFACVSEFNESGRRFYAAHGYQEVGLLKDLLVAGKHEILLRKSTGPGRST